MILNRGNWIFKGVVFLFCLLTVFFFLFFSFYFYTEKNYTDKVLPNIYVGSVDVSGKNKEEMIQAVNKRIDIFNLEGVVFRNSERIYVYPIESSSSGEFLTYLVSFNIDEAVEEAMKIGKTGVFLDDYLVRFKSIFLGEKHYKKLAVKIDHEKMLDRIYNKLDYYGSRDAYYYIDDNGLLQVEKEVPGKNFSYNKEDLEIKLSVLDLSENVLQETNYSPLLSESDYLEKKNEMKRILDYAPVKFGFDNEVWLADREEIIKWIRLNKEGRGLYLDMDKEKVISYIRENIAYVIDVPAETPEFVIEGGLLKNFQPGKNGVVVDVDYVAEEVMQLFEGKNYFKIKVKEIKPVVKIENGQGGLEGIQELIGESSLSFAGSSASRIKNIRNGASKISGLVIKPGEEFSTINSLKPIDEKNGYAKEAVINGGVITYELGGGLCHLSTTLFRAVLETGLPITMRKNHTYDLPYYLPSGTDATIYDPNPDFRFINDTGNNVLIISWIDEKSLYIQFWGTHDKRIVKKTDPIKKNIVYPRATKMINTKTLAKGVVQCNYAAYTGSNTSFDYIITYANGTVKSEKIESHYTPRQGVCYVGV